MYKIFILNFVVWVSLVAFSKASSNFKSCKTANNDAGFCVPPSECEYSKAKANLQGGPSSRATTILQQVQCGYDEAKTEMNKKILVCCPIGNNKASDVKSRFRNLESEAIPGNVLPEPGTCGTFLENKIVGGTITEFDEFPWTALLFYKNPNNKILAHSCGGSLINSRYILTAAHCINGTKLENWTLFRVRLGEWDLNQDPDCISPDECAPQHQDIDIERKIVHELYDPTSKNQQFDIGLLRLATVVSYNLFVKPICLPLTKQLQGLNLKDRSMIVVGWGETSPDNPSPIKLKATLKGWSLEDCHQKYKVLNYHLNETQICAGGVEKVDSCGGDSGGPLMINEKLDGRNVYFVAGIVSYGQTPCGLTNWPSVNTKVGSFIDWIQENLEP